MNRRRLLEMIPGALAWGTFALIVLFSWNLPYFTAVFIILFDIYWFLKSLYLSLHMRATFERIRENLKIDWLGKLDQPDSGLEPRTLNAGLPRWRGIRHLVIFPMYKEPYEVVRESFERLAAAEYPRENFFVVLATEEAAGEEAAAVARRVESEFGEKFGKFLITRHPAGLPGEIPGKGSNDAWAGAKAKEILIDPLVREGKLRYDQVLVSAFDIDTQAYPGYFARLTHAFLTSPDPLRAVYQPVPLFVNNIYQAPSLARIVAFSATFWQMVQQSRPERLTTFSSQSVPLPALLDVGWWQRDVVSEDSRIFWQGFLRYEGDFRVEPLHFPVSMDANAAPAFWGTLRNVYLQQRRWGWGAENIAYMLEGFMADGKIPRGKKWYWSWNMIEGFHSWATNSIMVFVLGWLPTLVGGEGFRGTLLSYNLPITTRFIMTLSMVGIATLALAAVMLLPPRPQGVGRGRYALYLAEWVLMPFTLIVFGAVPGLDAQTRLMLGGKFRLGFWATPKTRKGVGGTREGSPV